MACVLNLKLIRVAKFRLLGLESVCEALGESELLRALIACALNDF